MDLAARQHEMVTRKDRAKAESIANRLAKAVAAKAKRKPSRSAVARSMGIAPGTLWARQQVGSEASPLIKRRARRALQHAVDDGRVIKTPCVVCGNPRAEGHHPNYRRPLWVFWLCSAHHKQLHAGTLSADSAKIPAQVETFTGPARPRTKLTAEQVLSIRQGLVEGISVNKLSKIHGTAYGTIDSIAKGRTWKRQNLMATCISKQQIASGLTATIEAVTKIVAAIAEGSIILPPHAEEARVSFLRYAPYYEKGFNPNGDGLAYSAQDISELLGNSYASGHSSQWVCCALNVMAALEQGYAPENVIENISAAKKGFRVSSLSKALSAARTAHYKTKKRKKNAKRTLRKSIGLGRIK